jgi:hypothetical protein
MDRIGTASLMFGSNKSAGAIRFRSRMRPGKTGNPTGRRMESTSLTGRKLERAASMSFRRSVGVDTRGKYHHLDTILAGRLTVPRFCFRRATCQMPIDFMSSASMGVPLMRCLVNFFPSNKSVPDQQRGIPMEREYQYGLGVMRLSRLARIQEQRRFSGRCL